MRSHFAPVFLCLSLALAGCRSLPPSKPAAEWTAQEARGAQIFQQKCARCHEPNTTHRLKGPGLQAITKAGGFPFGSAMSDSDLQKIIVQGRGGMPARLLPEDQLGDLLAYLHTL